MMRKRYANAMQLRNGWYNVDLKRRQSDAGSDPAVSASLSRCTVDTVRYDTPDHSGQHTGIITPVLSTNHGRGTAGCGVNIATVSLGY